MNDTERTPQVFDAERCYRQRSTLHLGLHGRSGKDTHTGIDLHGLLDGFDVVKLHRRVHLHPVLAQVLVDFATNAQAGAEGDERFPLQLIGAGLVQSG